MKNRHWLLWAMAVPLFYSFVLTRVRWVISVYPSYGNTDIFAGVWLAIALLTAWVVLEVVHQIRRGRSGRCECGYSLRGIMCPECGRDLGAGGRD